MNKSKKSVISMNPIPFPVKKLSGEQSFFHALNWTEYYVDYKTGLIEHEDVNPEIIFAYANYLNDITEEVKYPI
jgi:hypothetical protein